MKKETGKKEVCIEPLNISRVKIPLRGKTPLLIDRMPPDVKNAIVEKQTGTIKSKKKLRNIQDEIKAAIHYTSKGEVGFPAGGFKAGMIESTSFVGDMKFSKKLLRGIKIVNVDNGLIPIKFKNQDILEHTVGANTKFTPQFHEWSCELVIEFDANNVSETDIVTLLNYAGFYYGVGIWSPRCRSGGEYGMYEVLANKKGGM